MSLDLGSIAISSDKVANLKSRGPAGSNQRGDSDPGEDPKKGYLRFVAGIAVKSDGTVGYVSAPFRRCAKPNGCHHGDRISVAA